MRHIFRADTIKQIFKSEVKTLHYAIFLLSSVYLRGTFIALESLYSDHLILTNH